MKTLLRSFKACKVNLVFLCFVVLGSVFSQHSFGQFTAGNLVVDVVGNGTPKDTFSGSRARLLQFTTAGVPVPGSSYFPYTGQPTTDPYNLVQSLVADDGYISLSENNRFISVPGYNDSEGTRDVTNQTTSSTSTLHGRTVGKLIPDGKMKTSATYNALSGGNYCSVVSKNDHFWLSGRGGIVYSKGHHTGGIGSVVTLSTDRTKVLGIFNSTLFVSIDSGSEPNRVRGIWQVGNFKEMPTSGTPALVNIINTGLQSNSYAFEFSPSGLICYIADDRLISVGNTGGIQKWVYSGTFSTKTGWAGGTWSLAYTLGTGSSVGARALTVDFSGANPIIYATTNERYPQTNRIISVVDAGASSPATTLATADPFYAFKGIAFAPFDKNPKNPTIVASALSPNSATTVYGVASSNMVFTVSGSNLTAGITITAPAGFEVSLSPTSGFGSSVVAGTGGVVPSTSIYVRLKSTDAVGSYSGIITCASTGAVTQNVVISNSTVTQATLTITAGDAVKCHGSTTLDYKGAQFTTSGLVNGDAVNGVTLTSTGSPASAPDGSYPIVPSDATGTGLSNYNIVYANGTLTVGSLEITLIQVNPDCNIPLGSLSSTILGGTAPYTYSVINSKTLVVTNSTDPLFSLPAGEYSYSAKDVNGCAGTAPGVGLEPLTKTPILVTSPGNSTQVCYGGSVTITTNVLGGTGPYGYSLNGGPFEPTSSRYFNVNATAGTYVITVNDINGCTVSTDPVTITQPSAPVTFTTAETVGCTGTGTITISPSGGYGSYTYSDDGGSSYQTDPIFVAPYGTYSMAVKDEMGCGQLLTQTVHLVALNSSDIVGNTTVCPSGSVGATTTLTIVAAGGTPPYTYSLNGGMFVAASQRYFNVGAGTYSITVMDAAGCTFTPPSVTVSTVDCGPSTAGNVGGHEVHNARNSSVSPIVGKQSLVQEFEAHLSPNPSPSLFHLQLQSSSNEDVELTVTNIMGMKVYESKGGINGAYDFGANFKNGMYVLQIRQGNTVHTVKLIKGN